MGFDERLHCGSLAATQLSCDGCYGLEKAACVHVFKTAMLARLFLNIKMNNELLLFQFLSP